MMSDLRKKTQESIETMHGLIDGCQLVMLVDQDTGLVLSKNSGSNISQNVLDAMAADARQQMRSAFAQRIANSAQAPRTLIISQFNQAGVVVVLQDLRACDDALVCQFDDMPDRADLIDIANEIFELSLSAEAA